MSDEDKKEIPFSKIESAYIEGTITEEDFVKLAKERYKNKDGSVDIIIEGAKRRKNPPDEDEVKNSFVRTTTVDKTILEAIMYNRKPMFLGLNTDTEPEKRWITTQFMNTPTVRYMPIEDTPYPPYTISNEDIVWMKLGVKKIPSLSAYYSRILKEFETFVAAPKEALAVFANTVLLSYQQHKFNSLGYPSILGIPDSGKTRVGEVIAGMAYRPLMSIKLNAANVYDFIGSENEGDCTIIDDEIQELNKDTEKREIYRSGYRKNARVRRIIDASSSSRSYRYYNTYCLKVLLGYYLPNDPALVSRCAPRIIMTSGYPERDEIEDEDRLRFREIKNKLLLSRMAHYFNPLPHKGVNLRGRIKEIWKPQLLTAYDTAAKDHIAKLVFEHIKDTDMERKTSLDAYLITVVSSLLGVHNTPSESFIEIWQTLLYYLNEGAHIEKESTTFQSSELDRKISKWLIGKRLKTAILGKESVEWMGTKSGRVYTFDRSVVDDIAKRFKITNDDKFNCIRSRYGTSVITDEAAKKWREP